MIYSFNLKLSKGPNETASSFVVSSGSHLYDINTKYKAKCTQLCFQCNNNKQFNYRLTIDDKELLFNVNSNPHFHKDMRLTTGGLAGHPAIGKIKNIRIEERKLKSLLIP